jgi:fluoride ion exporter CrcB/FEX
MKAYLIVFLGAGLGGALRHGVHVAALRLLGSGLPYGTLTVNIIGSLVMGLLTGYFTLRADIRARRGGCSWPLAFWAASRPFPHFRSIRPCSMSAERLD